MTRTKGPGRVTRLHVARGSSMACGRSSTPRFPSSDSAHLARDLAPPPNAPRSTPDGDSRKPRISCPPNLSPLIWRRHMAATPPDRAGRRTSGQALPRRSDEEHDVRARSQIAPRFRFGSFDDAIEGWCGTRLR